LSMSPGLNGMKRVWALLADSKSTVKSVVS
jgi:hypothetical protein